MGITLLEILVVGMAANFVTDIYEYLLERGLGRSRDWHLIGRWFAYLGLGMLVHRNIRDTPPVRHEFFLGWLFHYLVGIYFAGVYLIILVLVLQQPPGLLDALAFGVATVLATWLILIPGMGGGAFAWKTDRPNFIRVTSLSVHAVFGLGLYLGVLVYDAVW